MSRLARLLPVLMSTAGFSLPYTIDFTTLADGALPLFQGGSWAVVSGEAVVSPTYTAISLNAALTAWSGGNPTSWGLSGAGSVEENPAGQAHITGAKYLAQSSNVGTSFWLRAAAVCSVFVDGSPYIELEYNAGYRTPVTAAGSFRDDRYLGSGSRNYRFYSNDASEVTVDEIGLYRISNHFGLLPATAANVHVKAVKSAIAGATFRDWGGVIARADARTDPQNYLFAVTNEKGGTASLKVGKVVAGVYTELYSNANAGADIELRCNGTTIEVWNNAGLRTSLTVDEATINNNTIHGIVSTDGGNSLDSFFLSEAPVSKTVFIGGSNTEGDAYTECWPNYVKVVILPLASYEYWNEGYGGTTSWYALVRLQADVVAHAPSIVFIEFAVNDAGMGTGGTRANKWWPCLEAMIRRLRTALPDARIIITDLYQDNSVQTTDAPDYWAALATKYDCEYYSARVYLRTVLESEDPTDEQLAPYCDGVHWTRPLGHQTIADGLAPHLPDWYPHGASGWSGDLDDYAPLHFADEADWEATPQIIEGSAMTRTGTGWTVSGDVISSSTVDDTASFTGTFCSFGIYHPYPWTAFTFAWSIDGGDYTEYVAGSPGVHQISNFASAEHTVTIKVVSGTVKIEKFLAI